MILSLKSLLLIVLCVIAGSVPAGLALAQTTITTTGTSTGGGVLKITIEDFNKPGVFGRLSTLAVQDTDSTATTITVTIQDGWDCAHTALEIQEELIQHLPTTFAVVIFANYPCTVYIACNDESCRAFNITNIVSTVPGQTFMVAPAEVPIESVTWSQIKAKTWGGPSIRLH